ncbi:MAG: PDZ domain-containing protein [bacterium]|nr:PDZ domain-containing protein [bacterium]
MNKPIVFPLLIAFLLGFLILALPSTAQESSSESTSDTYLLRFNPEPGAVYTYSVSTSGNRGERIAVMSENYTLTVGDEGELGFAIVAEGEDVPEGAALGYRFQRAYYPQFPYSINELGETDISYGQPFPPFINIPLLPEGEVGIGSTWSGGPVGILPDKNVGTIPFTYESTLTSVASFRGENCAVIETNYSVVMAEPVQSLRPFLGIVEGDPPEVPGDGALVGGIVNGSRAEDAGILPGDLIIAIEGERIRGWGGLEEIMPLVVPEKELELTVMRGDEELDFVIIPEGAPVADVTASGGLKSTCMFSLDRGIPLKVDLKSENLVFMLRTSEEETEEKQADIHFVWEYQYAGR